MPAADVTVTALFVKELFTVTIDEMLNGIVAVKKTPAAYEYEEVVTLAVTAGVGYELSRLTMQAEGAKAPTDLDIAGPYTFHMPAANVLIDALFAAVRVKGIALDQTSAGMTVGDTLQLTAMLNPARPLPEPLNKKIRWVSSDESVATVDEDGKVTAAGRGEAEITRLPRTADIPIPARLPSSPRWSR